MRARIGTPRKTLLRDAEEAADLVLLPRRGGSKWDLSTRRTTQFLEIFRLVPFRVWQRPLCVDSNVTQTFWPTRR